LNGKHFLGQTIVDYAWVAWAGPKVVFLEVSIEKARIAAGGTDVDNFGELDKPGGFHQVRTHHQVTVIKISWFGDIDPDSAIISSGVEQDVARVF
jgi:hypothetical protein